MKRNLKKIFKKISFIFQLCIILGTPLNSVQTSATLTLNHPGPEDQELSAVEQQFLSSDESELKKIVCDFYDQAKSNGLAEQLPEPFLLCYALVKDNVVPVQKDDLLIALRSVLHWLDEQLEIAQQTRKPRIETAKQSEEEPRAPRPDAPTPANPNFPVGPSGCCDQSEVLRLLGTIRARIGSVDECSCDGTILSILGDACTILGPCETISGGIKNIETCCNNTFTTMVTDFNATWTILAALTTPTVIVTVDLSPIFTALVPIQQCCSNLTATVLREFNETWTILATLTTPTVTVNCDISGVYTTLGNVGNILGKDATISGTLKDITTCCSNLTATVLREFNETWTILAALTTSSCDLSGVYTTLGNVGNILGANATISGTLLNIIQTDNALTATVIRDFNETWTQLSAIQTCCSNLTATILREFNETWTILAALTTPTVMVNCDVSGVYTTLGNVGDILGKDATISGTLKDIKTCCSNLTATVLREFNETWTILAALTTSSCDLSGVYTTLGNVGNILGANATISGTLLNIIQTDDALTATVIRDFNETWTQLSAIQTCCSNLTATVLREFNETWTILAEIDTDLDETWTILGNVGNILGANATISGTLLNIIQTDNALTATIIRDFNETWTQLSAIQTCCSNLTATVLREFNETWTILAALTMTVTIDCDLSGVYTTLGNAGNILGTNATISGTLLNIIQTDNALTATVIRDFNETWTQLSAIQTCCSNLTATVLREFNETWTILAEIDTDLDETWTILGNVGNILGANATISGTLLNIVQGQNSLTATVLREFNETWTILAEIDTDLDETWTILGNVGNILGANATISGTLLNIIQTDNALTATVIREFNETWTQLSAVQTCCSNLTATVLREFNETWTILAEIDTDLDETWTILGNVGNILGANATISGTLLNIMQGQNFLTATVLREFNETWTILAEIDTDLDETWTILGNVGNILGANATISGTLLNIIQTDNALTATVIREFNETWTILAEIDTDLDETWTILGNVGNILGANATISGTLLNIMQGQNSLTATVLREFNETWTILAEIDTDLDETWTILGNVGNILGANSTISGTLLNIMQGLNSLTATVIRDFNETWTILAEIDTDFDETWTILNVLTSNECNPILIRQANVGVTTFTISQPGRYIFAENISFAPSSPQRAIDITSSNVTLDLLCHTLTQTNATSGVDGVRIASSLSNVIITHGTIQNFTRAGVTVNSACSRIILDTITAFSCNARGMELLGTSGAGNQITESEITNCKLVFCCLGPTGDIVLTLSQCTDVRVTNCRINQNGSSATTLQAVRLDNALKCELNTVETNDNLASTGFRGYELSQATYCIFKNCVTKNNQAVSAASNNRGFILESSTSCTANEFLDCSALNLTGTASVDGFLTDTGCNDNLFMRCEASFNSSQGTAATAIVHGFNVISNSRNIYIDCIARNNSAPNSTATPAPAFGAKGFDVNTCTACTLLRCLATDQSTGAGSTAVGIQVNQGSQCSIRDCQSSRHSVGYRLDPINSTNHVFSRNFAGKNTTQYSQFPGGSTQNAAGINNINASLMSPWTNVSVG